MIERTTDTAVELAPDASRTDEPANSLAHRDMADQTVDSRSKPHVASLVWELPSQLHEVQGQVVQDLGYPHEFFFFDEAIPKGTEIVLVQGPYGSISHLVRQLRKRPPDQRPVLAYWWQQSMDLSWPPRVRRIVTTTFSDLYRDFGAIGGLNRLLDLVAQDFVASKGRRLGYMGDIFWLHENGYLDVLALSSTVYKDYLAHFGIPSLLVPRGHHPDYGERRGLERDIPAVWMGKLRTSRRRQGVHWIRNELRKHGKDLLVFDGQERDFIYADERTRILNRTWFVLNLFFSGPTDELSIRFFIAAANGAVVLTEPGLNQYPFVPGKHLLEAPIELMPDTILYYLKHPDALQRIADNMHALIREDITLQQSIARILRTAETKQPVRT